MKVCGRNCVSLHYIYIFPALIIGHNARLDDAHSLKTRRRQGRNPPTRAVIIPCRQDSRHGEPVLWCKCTAHSSNLQCKNTMGVSVISNPYLRTTAMGLRKAYKGIDNCLHIWSTLATSNSPIPVIYSSTSALGFDRRPWRQRRVLPAGVRPPLE